MPNIGFSQSGLDDATLRGNVECAYRLETSKETLYSKCGFKEMDTKRPFEEFTSFTGLGTAKEKHAFTAVQTDVPKQNYLKRVSVISYAIATGIDSATMRFIKGGHKDVREAIAPAKLVAESMRNTNELMAADVFGNAFSTSFPHPDGAALCSASHKLGGSGAAASNTLGAVSMSQTSFEAALIAANKMPSDRNIPMGTGDNHMVVCPEDLAFTAKRILESEGQSDTASRALNALKGRYTKIQTNRLLPSSSNWFVLNTDIDYCLIALFETKPDIKSFGDEKVDAMWWKCYQMCAFDFYEWRGILGSSV
jgi:hypothetical protein